MISGKDQPPFALKTVRQVLDPEKRLRKGDCMSDSMGTMWSGMLRLSEKRLLCRDRAVWEVGTNPPQLPDKGSNDLRWTVAH